MLRISELRRATSFRLALLFAGLFGTASVLFALALFLMTSRFLSGNPDERMRAEAAGFDGRPSAASVTIMDQHSVDDAFGRRPFGIFDAKGRWLAGNLRRLPEPMPPVESFFETQTRTEGGRGTIYRSILHRLPNGNLLVVSRNIEELAKFRVEVREATIIGMVLMALLGLIGGIAVGAISLRRLDAVTQAIERITRGDLSQRLPSRGTGDDLDRLVRVVNSMLDQLERLMGEVKGVCDSIAHDLRTPLTRLLAGLERASRRSLSDPERATEIDRAIGEVQVTLRTFDALLRISEIEDGARRSAFREVDLNQVAADAVDHYEPAAEAKGIDLDFAEQPPGAPVLFQGDVDLLFEAIANLIDNAIKFTPEGGTIRVRLDVGPQLVVEDSGRGIAKRDRDSVHLRFHRGTRSRGTAGNGLGLPLVGAIARLHGMELRIENARPGCRIILAPPANGEIGATLH